MVRTRVDREKELRQKLGVTSWEEDCEEDPADLRKRAIEALKKEGGGYEGVQHKPKCKENPYQARTQAPAARASASAASATSRPSRRLSRRSCSGSSASRPTRRRRVV